MFWDYKIGANVLFIYYFVVSHVNGISSPYLSPPPSPYFKSFIYTTFSRILRPYIMSIHLSFDWSRHILYDDNRNKIKMCNDMKGTFYHRPFTVAQLVFNRFFCSRGEHYKIVIVINE